MALLTGAIEDDSRSWRMFGFEVGILGTTFVAREDANEAMREAAAARPLDPPQLPLSRRRTP